MGWNWTREMFRTRRLNSRCADERLDRDTARGNPVMLRIGAEPVAIRGRPVAEDDASDPEARWRGEMVSVAAFVIDECRHKRASPECNDRVTTTILRTNARGGRRFSAWVAGERASSPSSFGRDRQERDTRA